MICLTSDYCACDDSSLMMESFVREFDSEREAALAFLTLASRSQYAKDVSSRWSILTKYEFPKDLYFSVHFNGKHVIGVKR